MSVRFAKSRLSTESSAYWFAESARKPSVGSSQPTANTSGLRQSPRKMGRCDQPPKSLSIKDLGKPGRHKSLIVSDL
jgi:hypothetical protein